MVKDEADGKEMKLCTSVFKDGGSTTTKSVYTHVWTELISVLEQRT